jgi:outer membrane protein assembly factor BamC
MDNLAGGARVDYRSEASKTPSLEVPPDLTQLAREGRFRPQSGVVSASAVAAGAGVAAAPSAAVALSSLGNMRIERQGSHRWLVVPMTPEQLWPQLQSFWQGNGFSLAFENAATGVIETAWAENRAKLPQDFIRRTIGRVLENAYDTGVRDAFRTRLERGANGTEVYILHRSVTEEFADATRDRTVWHTAPNDPMLEAEFLARLMVQLGAPEAAARTAAAPTPAPSAPAAPAAPAAAAAAPAGAGATSLEINEPFDRAWRRVGLALDRTGFTVEDRDRSAGLYFVRYIATAPGGSEDAGFLSRIFGGKDAQAPVRYRVQVKAAGEGKSTVTVQNSQGAAETGDVARRIIALVSNDLR